MEKLHGPDKDAHQVPKRDPEAPEQIQLEQVQAEQVQQLPAIGGDKAGAKAGPKVNAESPGHNSSNMPVVSENGTAARKSAQARREARAQHVFGALDLGTNNCRLLIAHPTRRSFRVIGAFSRIIRLGEGISRNGALSEAAMVRTIEALKICAEKMIRCNVTSSRLVLN